MVDEDVYRGVRVSRYEVVCVAEKRHGLPVGTDRRTGGVVIALDSRRVGADAGRNARVQLLLLHAQHPDESLGHTHTRVYPSSKPRRCRKVAERAIRSPGAETLARDLK